MQLRMTNQRELILKELQKSNKHLSADELYERVKRVMPRMSLATVYRNLETLSEAGLIGKLEISGRQKRFDAEPKAHDHIYCVQCHRVDNMAIDRKLVKMAHLQATKGYTVTGFRVEFAGICSGCRAQK